ncbi:hypothetical protein [Thioclava sp. F36-7]|uniref:hypothetical protein n=1 Tax=Thioclava sp. F36-7 TaxID=1915317 RepID=UPI00143940C7|nr:hypothetical protein [Thioclava sp. F36-7]
MIGIWAQSFTIATGLDQRPGLPAARSHRRSHRRAKISAELVLPKDDPKIDGR